MLFITADKIGYGRRRTNKWLRDCRTQWVDEVNLMNITYDYYKIFYYVAKYHSFTKAASVLMNNQPNITRSMNNLEHELGCRLLLRSNRGVKLTPEGEKLFRHVALAVEQIQAGEEELRTAQSLQNGQVSIGASETALHGLLLHKLGEFHREYPGVRIRISNQTTPQAIQALKNGVVDFAVITNPSGVSRPLKEIPLKSFREILVGGPQFLPLSENTWHLRELEPYSFVCMDKKSRSYELYGDFFLEHGLILEPDLEAATMDQVLLMVKNGLGIGFLPEEFARDALEKKEIFRIHLYEEPPKRSISLIQDMERPLNVAAKRLTELLCSWGSHSSPS